MVISHLGRKSLVLENKQVSYWGEKKKMHPGNVGAVIHDQNPKQEIMIMCVSQTCLMSGNEERPMYLLLLKNQAQDTVWNKKELTLKFNLIKFKNSSMPYHWGQICPRTCCKKHKDICSALQVNNMTNYSFAFAFYIFSPSPGRQRSSTTSQKAADAPCDLLFSCCCICSLVIVVIINSNNSN